MTPCLVRLFVPLPGPLEDPWRRGRAFEPLFGAPVALFSDPLGHLEFCALGTAWAAVLPHEGRFAAAREALGRLREHSITLGPTPAVEGPTLLCAFAFERAACGRQGPFGPLDGGRMLLPNCVVLQAVSPGGTVSQGVMLQLLAPDASEAAQTAARATLEGWAQAVRRLSAGPLPAAPAGAAMLPGPGAQEAQEPSGPGHSAQADYEAAVACAQAALGAGLHKVVLARCRTVPVQVAPEATAFALRTGLGRATCFSLTLPGGSYFLGATPETLVRLTAGAVATEALAGTAPRGENAGADARARAALLCSAKDLGEHAVVVQGMVQALGPQVTKLSHPEHPEASALTRIWHLRTPIAAIARPGVDVLALVAALHPTPALGGQPKNAAQAYLLQHEPFRRGLYAAPLGWAGLDGDGVFVAGIRSLWCDAHEAVLFAGAGIVAASNPQAEWRETELKLTTAAAGLRTRPAAGEDLS